MLQRDRSIKVNSTKNLMVNMFKHGARLNAKDISKGPAYAENILLAWSGMDNYKDQPASEKYALLSSLCKKDDIFKGKEGDITRRFYMGYFLGQQGRYIEGSAERNKLYASALDHFTAWLLANRRKGEPQYYALLRCGELMAVLQYPWCKAEDRLMTAFEVMPERGESIEAIVRHYLLTQQFSIAYIFTSYAIGAFFLRSPSRSQWGVKESYYNWQVLDMHIAACFNMGLMDEARSHFANLMEHTRQKPSFFQPAEIQGIHSKAALFNYVAVS